MNRIKIVVLVSLGVSVGFFSGALACAYSIPLQEILRPSKYGWRFSNKQILGVNESFLDGDAINLLQMTAESDNRTPLSELSFRKKFSPGSEPPFYQIQVHPVFWPVPKWQHYIFASKRGSVVRLEEKPGSDWTVFVDDYPELEFRRRRTSLERRPGVFDDTEEWQIVHRFRGNHYVGQSGNPTVAEPKR